MTRTRLFRHHNLFILRPMFAAYGRSVENSAICFVSQAAQSEAIGDKLGLAKQTKAVQNTRSISKMDMALNNYLPDIEVIQKLTKFAQMVSC